MIHDRTAFPIALIFMILAMAGIIILIVYTVVWSPTISGPSCQTNRSCAVNQVCMREGCAPVTCSTDDQCEGICISSTCYPYTCALGNDCPSEMACVNGACVTVGATCSQNADCDQLTCLNSQCVQCQANSDCPVGQGCFNQSCRYPTVGQTGANLLFYDSNSFQRGNITAPPGYFCSQTTCSPNGQTGFISCGETGCNSDCPYCIDSVCRCTPGELYENCKQNSDCKSGICSGTDFGRVCIPSGGACVFNYSTTGCSGCCPSPAEPYCVDGKCSDTSLGAICGSSNLPADLCNNPSSIGGIGVTGMAPDGMGFFCVNGRCQSTPGTLNDWCTEGGCEFIDAGQFTCSTSRCVSDI